MNQQDAIHHSKFLSRHLRHKPEAIGLTLQVGGWVAVADLLAACAAHGHPLTRDELDDLVEDNDKQRFAYDEAGQRIRAQQGHSVAVDLELDPAMPPAVLYHGTAPAALPAIQATGLQKMSRHHVHLTADKTTARRVGQRRGRPVLLAIDAAAWHAAGGVFYRSGNGVWLTEAVPPQYVQEV
jgi:putative RNA 2'-phosphotransferase